MSVGAAWPSVSQRIRLPALLVGAVGLGLCLLAGLVWPWRVYPAFLVGYLFWIGIALGSLSLTMLHRLVGGSWGLPVRRPMEAAALTIPVLAVLFFVSLPFGMSHLYRWADPGLASKFPDLHFNHHYLNVRAFLTRAVVYFVIWTGLAYLMARWSVRQDETTDPTASRWAQDVSGPGLALLFVTGTFAMVDWVMSLEPDWYSTIYGAMLIVGQGLATFAAMILVATALARAGVEPMARAVTPGRLNDLGNLLLAFVMLWAYLSFSQFLIIWCGNLAEEIPWYLRRTRGGWQVVVVALMVFHFFVPFFFLLFRDVKRGTGLLMGLSAAILVMHLVDLTWLVLPAHSDIGAKAEPYSRPGVPWSTLPFVIAAWAGVGGVWITAFLRQLALRPLVPRNDPGIDEAAEAGHDGGH